MKFDLYQVTLILRLHPPISCFVPVSSRSARTATRASFARITVRTRTLTETLIRSHHTFTPVRPCYQTFMTTLWRESGWITNDWPIFPLHYYNTIATQCVSLCSSFLPLLVRQQPVMTCVPSNSTGILQTLILLLCITATRSNPLWIRRESTASPPKSRLSKTAEEGSISIRMEDGAPLSMDMIGAGIDFLRSTTGERRASPGDVTRTRPVPTTAAWQSLRLAKNATEPSRPSLYPFFFFFVSVNAQQHRQINKYISNMVNPKRRVWV